MMRLRWLLLVLLVVLGGCAPEHLPDLPPSPLTRDVPDDSVANVVFWIGDAGAAEWSKSPVLHKLAAEVDHYSRVIARDSAVAVVYLGDNIYPAGLHDANEKQFPQDSARLQAQVDVMRAPNTRRYNSFAIFIPGNHDWGHKMNQGGIQRMTNQEKFLDRRRAEGINVSLLPTGQAPGPAMIDVGRHLRILFLDTAWWLLAGDREEKEVVMQRLETEMRTRGNREIILAAHHPYKSASSHGGLQPFWEGLGIRWLLARSGAALQDLNSLPYRDLLDRMKYIFERTEPPLLFAGGHDHVLQLIKGTEDLDPRFMLVSGAGSKLSDVGHIDGMLFRGAQPGYMRLMVKTNGQMALFVVSGPDSMLACDHADAAANARCVAEGIAAFRSDFGVPIR